MNHKNQIKPKDRMPLPRFRVIEGVVDLLQETIFKYQMFQEIDDAWRTGGTDKFFVSANQLAECLHNSLVSFQKEYNGVSKVTWDEIFKHTFFYRDVPTSCQLMWWLKMLYPYLASQETKP